MNELNVEHKLIWVEGLLIACPFGKALGDCPASDLRELPITDRLELAAQFTEAELDGREVGASIGVDLFTVGQIVDVTGQSKGKGFQGGVKRWNFRTQDATHGNSVSHRVLGSTGQNQTPGRVFKGKKMAGHLGDERVTVQGLEIVSIDAERSVLVVKGAVPGATNGDVIVRPTIKA